MAHRRLSPRAVAVLRALAEDPERWRYGYDLCNQLGVAAGTMYPILIRLADRGMLETSWETERVPGRPARHLYRLTGAGRAHAASLGPAPAATPAPPKPARSPRRLRWDGA
ncbi:helix-turn-helix transcriptional regulator [Actinocatenispora sera]|uniref:PadR family transcriptional regulator n=1 Tax=Actinocatenispora sera TaxID=390989 RepID=UPI0033DA599D